MSPDVLSPDLLSANVEALVKAQGVAPTLTDVRDTIRVSFTNGDVQAELCIDGNDWHPLDFPAGPSQEARQWLTAARGDSTQMIVAGAGLGHALDHAEAIGVTKILAIEPDPGLAAVFLARRDWRDWFSQGRLRLITGPDYRGASDIARFLDGLSDIPIAAHPLRVRAEPRAVALATVVASRIAGNARSNGEARRKFAGPYLLQTLGNLRTIAREANVEALNGALAGTPAIVIGAGPSLDDNVHDLRRFRDRAVLIAADTAVNPLLAAGLQPDIAVAADSSALNARHLATAAAATETMLVVEGSVHPSAIDAFSGRMFTFRVSEHDPWPWLWEAGIARGELRTWGSVLTSAFDVARRLGCSPIVFAGADLAFTGLRPYCRGTIYDAMWQEWIDKGCTWEQLMTDYFSRLPELWVDDVHGAQVRTAPHLVSFRNWLVEQASRSAPETTFLNATGGGILHGASIAQTTLAEVFAARQSQPHIRQVLRQRHADAVRDGADARRLETLLAHARSTPGALPVDRWHTFAAGAVSSADIHAAIADLG